MGGACCYGVPPRRPPPGEPHDLDAQGVFTELIQEMQVKGVQIHLHFKRAIPTYRIRELPEEHILGDLKGFGYNVKTEDRTILRVIGFYNAKGDVFTVAFSTIANPFACIRVMRLEVPE